MEALAFIFVLLAFIALLLPEKKPDPPSPGDQLMKGLSAAYKELTGGGGPKKPEPGFWDSPWAVIFLAIVLGLLFTYGL